MQDESKGIPRIYDDATDVVGGEPFYVWIQRSDEPLRQGQLCHAPVWYEKKNKWYLEEHRYEPGDEKESTWYARKLQTGRFPEMDGMVKKYFELEKDEILITTNGKIRPVILLREYSSDWLYPGVYKLNKWLCLPIFSYKSRHYQDWVEKDQRLEVFDRFYLPQSHRGGPGIGVEGAARFHAIQAIDARNLEPAKSMCSNGEVKMQQPYALSATALRILVYHLFKAFELFSELKIQKDDYDIFKMFVDEALDSAKTK